MAVDEILMESQKKNARPVLRIYSWERPSYSIGYFQSAPDIAKRFGCDKKNIPVVRRPSGGGVVFHDGDITFSLSLGNPNPFLTGDAKSSYLKINEALASGLRDMYAGLDFFDCRSVPSGRAGNGRVCFEEPACYDLLWKGKKVVGASQRRKKDAVLYQSSVALRGDREKIIACMLEGFRKKWSVTFEEAPLTEPELEKARARLGNY
jgi:lipoate-protein ligase A